MNWAQAASRVGAIGKSPSQNAPHTLANFQSLPKFFLILTPMNYELGTSYKLAPADEPWAKFERRMSEG